MNRMKALLAATAIIAVPTIATAGAEFGSEAEAWALVDEMVGVIQDSGLDAGIAAMHDAGQPFAETKMGVHIFEAGIIVADNREPELIASSYEEVADLTNEPMWPRIVEAANAESEAVLEWYHYDTEAEYTYHCPSKWAKGEEVLVMVCR